MARAVFNTTGMDAGSKTRLQDCLLKVLISDTITESSDITDTVIQDYIDQHLSDIIQGQESKQYQKDYSFTPPTF